MVALVGAVSGHYIFKDPLDEYWREKHREEREKQQQLASGGRTSNVQANTKTADGNSSR